MFLFYACLQRCEAGYILVCFSLLLEIVKESYE